MTHLPQCIGALVVIIGDGGPVAAPIEARSSRKHVKRLPSIIRNIGPAVLAFVFVCASLWFAGCNYLRSSSSAPRVSYTRSPDR